MHLVCVTSRLTDKCACALDTGKECRSLHMVFSGIVTFSTVVVSFLPVTARARRTDGPAYPCGRKVPHLAQFFFSVPTRLRLGALVRKDGQGVKAVAKSGPLWNPQPVSNQANVVSFSRPWMVFPVHGASVQPLAFRVHLCAWLVTSDYVQTLASQV